VTLDTAVGNLRQKGVAEPRSHLNQLVDQRLLVIEDRGGVSRVELTHDVLAVLALRSRRERQQRRTEEGRVKELAEARRKARIRAILLGAMLLLTCGAIAGGILTDENDSDEILTQGK
jgi:hypothetical protein